jgi:hypothetical protein
MTSLQGNARLMRSTPPGPAGLKGPLQLPFFDDFTHPGPYPDPARWEDPLVYVNRHFVNDPITLGVATFDGLDATGRPYDIDARPKDIIRPTDTLTSLPIALSGKTEEDSVVLSFYYLSQGLGEAPRGADSLTLELRADSVVRYVDSQETQIDTILYDQWIQVWSVTGEESRDMEGFQYVAVQPPSDPDQAFYTDRFRFRFRSFGTPTGAGDHWHIDYVYLGEGRDVNDAAPNFSDIAISGVPRGILQTYTQIPYRHYFENPNDYFRTIDSISYRVLQDRTQLTVRSEVIFRNGLSSQEYLVNRLNTLFQNDQPEDFKEQTIAYDHLANLSRPPLFGGGDEAVVEIEHRTARGNPEDEFSENDTVTFRQKLDQAYAYDDGTAERSYSLVGGFVQGKFALKFTSLEPDRLRGVAFMFSPFLSDVTTESIDITVWDQINESGSDAGDSVLTQLSSAQPVYQEQNGFTYYELENPVRIRADDPFYVGWQQTPDLLVNLGVDRNYRRFVNFTQPHPGAFVNLTGTWQRSQVLRGAPMIRVYLSGDPLPDNPTDEPNRDPTPEPSGVEIYPNPLPVGGALRLDELPSAGSYELFNTVGTKVREGRLQEGSNTLALNSLPQGMYILRWQTDSGTPSGQEWLLIR